MKPDPILRTRPTSRAGARVLASASLLGMVLLAGCSGAAPEGPLDTGTVGPPMDPSGHSSSTAPAGSASASASESAPAASSETASEISSASPTAADEIDTADWKTFSTQGISFKHPVEWTIEADPCDDCNSSAEPHDDRYTKWDIKNSSGTEIAEFRADSAIDTDGDTGVYDRTVLESTPSEAQLLAPAEVVFEHMVVDDADDDDEQEQRVLLMLNDTAATKKRDEKPALSYFSPAKDLSSQMFSTDDFVDDLGFDEDHVSKEDAAKIMTSEDYRRLRAMMLSVRLGT